MSPLVKGIFIGMAFLIVLIASCVAVGYFSYNKGYLSGNQKGKNEGYNLGFKQGRQPTNEELQAENRRSSAVSDIVTLTENYTKLYDLCETKYQYGLSGNLNKALEVKGQMTQIENDIYEIEKKYNINNDGTNATFQ